jgi:hypothetical protein
LCKNLTRCGKWVSERVKREEYWKLFPTEHFKRQRTDLSIAIFSK